MPTISFGFAQTEESKTNPTSIPIWIKSNAEWWAQGLISDKDFLAGIGYMVKEKIIQVANVELDSQGSVAVDDNVQVPKWIRSNAEWWSEGKISDDDFKSGIQFMVKEKIIDFKERPSVARTQTAKTIGELDFSSEEQHKAVTAASTIVVAEEKMQGWLLEAENYAIKRLDDKIDEAWHTFDETSDKNDMNRALALQDQLDDVEELSKTTLGALKDTTERKENFFQCAQESGFDKFVLETNANSKLGSSAEVSTIKTDKDYEDATDAAKEVEKIIEKAVQELRETLKRYDEGRGSSPEWKYDTLTGWWWFKGLDDVFYYIDKSGEMTVTIQGFRYKYVPPVWEPTTTGELIFKGPDGVIYWIDKSGEMFLRTSTGYKYKYTTLPPLPSITPSCDVVLFSSTSEPAIFQALDTYGSMYELLDSLTSSSSSTSSETSSSSTSSETSSSSTSSETSTQPEEKRWIPVYLIAVQYFPQIQFSWTAPHEGACDDWHIHASQAYNADAQLVSLTDPNPSGCGFGTVTTMSSHSLEMTQSQIDAWEAAAGMDINPGQ